EQLGNCETNAAGRAGDDAAQIAEAEVHGWLAYPRMTTLLLVRHGETDWNAAGRLQGHTDRPLNDYGRQQARELGDRLAGDRIAAVYASDLVRARETAEILGERLGLVVVLDPDLREKNWGTWEGLTGDERAHIEFEGESTEAHRERVLRAVQR